MTRGYGSARTTSEITRSGSTWKFFSARFPRSSRAAAPTNISLDASDVLKSLRYYINGQASTFGRYLLQELVVGLFGWLPSLLGIAARAIVYKLIMRIDGFVAI